MRRIHQLTLAIGGKPIVDGLSLQLAAGDCLAILGQNGVGKSTLLNTLAGLHAPQAGQILLQEKNLGDYRSTALARLRAWLPQTQEDAFAATVLETVLIGRHPWLSRFEWESPADIARAHAALQAVGLADFATRNVQTLSGGERQRVALAALSLQDAPLWLLDEPLNHLDTAWQIAMLARMATRATQGHALALVLHDLNLARRYCNRFLLLFGAGHWHLTDRVGLADLDLIQRLWGHPAQQLGEAEEAWFIPA